MGWKATIDISEREAKQLIIERLVQLDNLSYSELEDMIESLGYGDDTRLQYYGYNFNVVPDETIRGE